jgi:AAA15 family ATPase/GTPase
MIVSLKIKNFLSYKKQEIFSFEASSDNSMEETHVVEIVPGTRLLKFAVVYGANASGKSNLISAFEFLKYFLQNKNDSKETPIMVTPFLLDSESEQQPTEFELTFFIEKIKHIYTVVLTKQYIIKEKLTQYLTEKPALIFERIYKNNVSQIKFGSKIKIPILVKKEIELKCLPNTSVFAAYNQVNANVEELSNVINWIQYKYFPPINMRIDLNRYVIKQLDNEKKRESIINFLREADFNINKVSIQNMAVSIPEDFAEQLLSDKSIPDVEKQRIRENKNINIKQLTFSHKVTEPDGKVEEFELSDKLESGGTLKTMNLACVINDVIESDAFLTIDEIETSLHPKLVQFIIEKFMRDSEQSQLLVTTHYDGLLNEKDLIRRDNIWFTEKRNDGSTELFSLIDFKSQKRIHSLKNAYHSGRFGAIPNI